MSRFCNSCVESHTDEAGYDSQETQLCDSSGSEASSHPSMAELCDSSGSRSESGYDSQETQQYLPDLNDMPELCDSSRSESGYDSQETQYLPLFIAGTTCVKPEFCDLSGSESGYDSQETQYLPPQSAFDGTLHEDGFDTVKSALPRFPMASDSGQGS